MKRKTFGGEMNKDEALTLAAIVILFLTALVNWTFYSWLILLALILLLFAWYFRKGK